MEKLISKKLTNCYKKAKEIVKQNQTVIKEIADLMMEKGQVDGDTIRQIINRNRKGSR